jgi:hypothetical protein
MRADFTAKPQSRKENRHDESAAAAENPARDGGCEKIRAGIPAATRRMIPRDYNSIHAKKS